MGKTPFDAESLERLQNILGCHFHDSRLLAQAMTHSSWANGHGQTGMHNERLEFLGDAVLELCVSDFLYRTLPSAREGELTAMRQAFVNGRTLGEIASDMGLPELVRASLGDEWQGERQRLSIGADALEAIIAAVYLDGGFGKARKFVDSLLSRHKMPYAANGDNSSAKNRLQEETMRVFQSLPEYGTVSETGPEHAKTFLVEVVLPDGRKFRGQGSNRKNAEKDAAANALEAMREGGKTGDAGNSGDN